MEYYGSVTQPSELLFLTKAPVCDPGPYAKESVYSNDVIPEITPVVVNSLALFPFPQMQR